MEHGHALTPDERDVLMMALQTPLVERDPVMLGLCLRLCGRRLLQRAGTAAVMNGWRGSPHAFVLTREGWNVVKAQRHAWPMKRTA
ncbi:hypothetical protein [Phenylobacterium sp. J367]|uniref:hypothetical protein n=1 Tax=Phenylobacterium sp. J367 TaxID=2898435 RepID=UPI002151945E|nr:hypothetical protein [Phenylobacterium sp. J367]MCR5880393.1 hypothetical protein [Phenylobacterium sp. J367]